MRSVWDTDADAKLLMGPVEVKDGMVEFGLGKSTKYFVTKERIGEAGGIPAGFVIAGLVGLGALLIVGAVILIMAMKKKKKNDSNDLGDAAGGISGEIGMFGPTPGVGGPDFDAGPNSGAGGIFG